MNEGPDLEAMTKLTANDADRQLGERIHVHGKKKRSR